MSKGWAAPDAPMDDFRPAIMPGEGDDPSALDILSASAESMRATDLTTSRTDNARRAYEELERAVIADVGGTRRDMQGALDELDVPELRGVEGYRRWAMATGTADKYRLAQFRAYRNSLPADRRALIPDPDRLDARGREIALERVAEAETVLQHTRGAGDAALKVVGGIGGAMTDPVNLASMAIFRAPVSTLRGAVTYGAVTSGATELALQPFVQDYRAEVGLPSGWDVGLQNVLFATVGGAGFGLIEGGAIKLGQALKRRRAQGVAQPYEAELEALTAQRGSGDIDEAEFWQEVEGLAAREPALRAMLDINERAREAAEVDQVNPHGEGAEAQTRHRQDLANAEARARGEDEPFAREPARDPVSEPGEEEFTVWDTEGNPVTVRIEGRMDDEKLMLVTQDGQAFAHGEELHSVNPKDVDYVLMRVEGDPQANELTMESLRELEGQLAKDAETDFFAARDLTAIRTEIQRRELQAVPPDFSEMGLEVVDYRTIRRDPRRFQFKDSDEHGLTDALMDVTEWRKERAGVLLLWEDSNGVRYAANGHQRTGLAERLMAEGHDPIAGPAYILREADGATAEEAMVMGALINIGEGSGTSLDAARILRASPESADSLPPRSGLVREARGLAVLSDDAFGMVVNEVASAKWGALVGREVEDASLHAQALSVLNRVDPRTIGEGQSILRDLQRAPVENVTTIDLFGAETFRVSLIEERAKVKQAALAQLRSDKRSFGSLNRNQSRFENEGNRLDAERNAEVQTEAAILADRIDGEAHVKGEVSDALNEAARAVAEGESAVKAAERLVESLRGKAGEPRGGRGAGEAGRGEAERGSGPDGRQDSKAESEGLATARVSRSTDEDTLTTPAMVREAARDDVGDTAADMIDEAPDPNQGGLFEDGADFVDDFEARLRAAEPDLDDDAIARAMRYQALMGARRSPPERIVEEPREAETGEDIRAEADMMQSQLFDELAASGSELDDITVRHPETGEEVSAQSLFDEVEADDKALDRLRGCAYPGGET